MENQRVYFSFPEGAQASGSHQSGYFFVLSGRPVHFESVNRTKAPTSTCSVQRTTMLISVQLDKAYVVLWPNWPEDSV